MDEAYLEQHATVTAAAAHGSGAGWGDQQRGVG